MNINKDLERYLFEKNIYIVNDYFKGQGCRKEDAIINQLKLISEFQKILFNFNTRIYGGVISYIGRELEKTKNVLIILENKKENKKYSPLINCLKTLNTELKEIDFRKLVKRSMDRKEITIGRLDERNLRVLDEIEIGKIKRVNYNLIEEDAIAYLRKVKKSRNIYNLEYLISEYVRSANLDKESYKYIKSMVLAPIETINYISKYRSEIEEQKLLELMNIEGII